MACGLYLPYVSVFASPRCAARPRDSEASYGLLVLQMRCSDKGFPHSAARLKRLSGGLLPRLLTRRDEVTRRFPRSAARLEGSRDLRRAPEEALDRPPPLFHESESSCARRNYGLSSSLGMVGGGNEMNK